MSLPQQCPQVFRLITFKVERDAFKVAVEV